MGLPVFTTTEANPLSGKYTAVMRFLARSRILRSGRSAGSRCGWSNARSSREDEIG